MLFVLWLYSTKTVLNMTYKKLWLLIFVMGSEFKVYSSNNNCSNYHNMAKKKNKKITGYRPWGALAKVSHVLQHYHMLPYEAGNIDLEHSWNYKRKI